MLAVGGAVYRFALLRAMGFAVARVSAAEWRALGREGERGRSGYGFGGGRGDGRRSSNGRGRGGGRGRFSSSSSSSQPSSFWDDNDDEEGEEEEEELEEKEEGIGFFDPVAARMAAEDAFVARMMARAAPS
jgi:hypothetical protein